jgi:hypothetical protein
MQGENAVLILAVAILHPRVVFQRYGSFFDRRLGVQA